MTKSTSIVEYMSNEAVKDNIQETLGRKTAQFIASVASLVNSNPAVARCEQKSILSSCLVAASLDLPINQNLGFAYIIPYDKNTKVITKDEKGRELVIWEKVSQAQFQMGYKGFIQLAMRSGQFKTINVTDVREGELKGNNRLTGEMSFLWLENDVREKSVVVGYVAYMELTNGFTKQLYMSVAEIEKHAGRYSKAYKSKGTMNIWRDDFEVMAKKTLIKLLLSKYAPMTIDMQKATLADQAVIDGDQYQYPDNTPTDPNAVAAEKEQARIIKHIEISQTIADLDLCAEAVEALGMDSPTYKLYADKHQLLEEESNDGTQNK